MRGTVAKRLRKEGRVNPSNKRKYFSKYSPIIADDNRRNYKLLKKNYKEEKCKSI